jgi:hypothetical protein
MKSIKFQVWRTVSSTHQVEHVTRSIRKIVGDKVKWTVSREKGRLYRKKQLVYKYILEEDVNLL